MDRMPNLGINTEAVKQRAVVALIPLRDRDGKKEIFLVRGKGGNITSLAAK